MFGRVTFYPTLAYNIVLERLAVRKWYSRIDETVVLGALPWRTIVPQVQLFAITIGHDSNHYFH